MEQEATERGSPPTEGAAGTDSANQSLKAETSLGVVLGRPISARRLRPGPPMILAAIYAATILIGSLILRTDWAAPGGMDWPSAIFTATSAVTVTGLEVAPSHETLSAAGMAVLAVMMQIGGLGLMTFAVFAFVLLGFDPKKSVLRADFETVAQRKIWPLAIRITMTALVVQAVGIAVLGCALRVDEVNWGDIAFLGISAFNNAGFSPFEGSLELYAEQALVLGAVCTLFVVGGLGFFVLGDLADALRKRSLAPVSVHTKLTLVGVAAITLFGWLGLCLMTPMGPGLALFQALTPRTAGFDAYGAGDYSTGASALTIALMFIGAGATSTGGGIKVATISILVLAVIARLRRQVALRVFGVRVPFISIRRVAILVLVAAGVTTFGAGALMVSEGASFLDTLFEATSAFGTVGLTRGITADASTTGQMILAMLMFFGRIGPLALAYLLAARFIGPPEEVERQLPFG